MSTTNRARRSRGEWEQLLAEQAASGQTRADFCRDAGVALSTFTYWKRKLSKADLPAGDRQESDSPVFAELAVAAPGTGDVQPAGWDVELDLGGIVLRIRRAA